MQVYIIHYDISMNKYYTKLDLSLYNKNKNYA